MKQTLQVPLDGNCVPEAINPWAHPSGDSRTIPKAFESRQKCQKPDTNPASIFQVDVYDVSKKRY